MRFSLAISTLLGGVSTAEAINLNLRKTNSETAQQAEQDFKKAMNPRRLDDNEAQCYRKDELPLTPEFSGFASSNVCLNLPVQETFTLTSKDEIITAVTEARQDCWGIPGCLSRIDFSLNTTLQDCDIMEAITIQQGQCMVIAGPGVLADNEDGGGYIPDECSFDVERGGVLIFGNVRINGNVTAHEQSDVVLQSGTQYLATECPVRGATYTATDTCYFVVDAVEVDYDFSQVGTATMDYDTAVELCSSIESESLPVIIDNDVENFFVLELLQGVEGWIHADNWLQTSMPELWEDPNEARQWNYINSDGAQESYHPCVSLEAGGYWDSHNCTTAAVRKVVCEMTKRTFVDPAEVVTAQSDADIFAVTLSVTNSLLDANKMVFKDTESTVSIATLQMDKVGGQGVNRFPLYATVNADPSTFAIEITTTAPASFTIATNVDTNPLVSTISDDGLVTTARGMDPDALPTTAYIQSSDACITHIALTVDEEQAVDLDIFSLAACDLPIFEYDTVNECVYLSEAGTRDLVILLEESGCSRISVNRGVDFMESIYFYVTGSDLDELEFTNALTNEVLFANAPIDYAQSFPQLVRVKPLDGTTATSGITLTDVSLMAYGQIVTQWQASDTFMCLESCPDFATSTSLVFDSTSSDPLTDLIIDLNETECDMLEAVWINENITGEEQCTVSYDIYVDVDDIQSLVDDMVASGKRTLSLSVGLFDENATSIPSLSLDVPTYYKVVIETNWSISLPAINSSSITVEDGGYLELVGLRFTGDDVSFTNNGGTLDVAACDFVDGATLENNAGTTTMAGTTIQDDATTLTNYAGATLILESVYLVGTPTSNIINDGTLSMERCTISSDEFVQQGSGTWLLRDSEIYFPAADLTIDEACTDDSSLVVETSAFTQVSTSADCTALCNGDDDCSAAWFDSMAYSPGASADSLPLCGLCVPGSCDFNCSVPNSDLYRKNTLVPFTRIGPDACSPDETHNPVGVTPTTLEECRGWCSTFEFCHAFEFDETLSVCNFYDNATALNCGTGLATNALIPDSLFYVETYHTKGLGQFIELPSGLCFTGTSVSPPTDEYLLTADCAAFCGAWSECAGFEVYSGGVACNFWTWNSTLITDETCPSSYLSLADSRFPLAESERLDALRFDCAVNLDLASNTATVGGIEECRALCNKNALCDAFSLNWNTRENCYLFSKDFLDGLGDSEICLPTNGVTYLIHTRHDFEEVNSTEAEALDCPGNGIGYIEGVYTQDACQMVCLKMSDCSSIHFDAEAAEGEMCALSCANNTGVNQTHVVITTPAEVVYVAYKTIEVCSPDLVEVNFTSAEPEEEGSACRILCDVTAPCIAYQVDDSYKCTMYSDVQIDPEVEDLGCASPVTIDYAYAGKRAFDFLLAPSATQLVAEAVEADPVVYTVRECMNSCIITEECEAIKFSADGRCYLYSSNVMESDSGSIVVGQDQYYIWYSQFYYEEAIDGAAYGGDTELHVEVEMPTKASCTRLCSMTIGCGAVEYDEDILECRILGGDAAYSDNTQDAIPAIYDQVLVNPFVQAVTDESSSICPDSSRLMWSTTQYTAEACQALCLANYGCGSVLFLKSTQTCSLYPSDSFLATDSDECDTVRTDGDKLFLSYLHFLVPDSTVYATLEAEAGATEFLCVANSTEIYTYDNITSETACADACNNRLAVEECGAYQFTDGITECILMKNDLELEACDTEPAAKIGFGYISAAFTPPELDDQCFDDSTEINVFYGLRDSPECASLCESHFTCRAFRMVGADCHLYSSAITHNCTDTDDEGDAYTYYSSRDYTRLGAEYCVASDLEVVSLVGIEVEACKGVCDSTDLCVSFEHNQDGECVLYTSTDFYKCTNTARDLYISSATVNAYRDEPEKMVTLDEICMIFQDEAPTTCEATGVCSLGEPCSNNNECRDDLECVSLTGFYFGVELDGESFCTHPSTPLSGTSLTAEECSDLCLDDSECQATALAEGTCFLLDETDMDRLEASNACAQSSTYVQIKYRSNPYKEMSGACLRNDLSSSVGPFDGMDLVNCMNLCENYAFCRHFVLSDDGLCTLYAAQVGGVDEGCAQADDETTYWNSRSFIDAIEYMGVPEHVFVAQTGLTYQECAAACDELEYCNAFLHDWGYRQNAKYLDVAFEPQRLATPLDSTGTTNARVLVVNQDGSISTEAQLDVGDYSDQRIAFEEIYDEADTVRIRFRAYDTCLATSSDTDDTAALAAVDCEDDDDKQKWLMTLVDDFYQFESVAHGGCLSWYQDISTADTQVGCNAGSDSTKWTQASGALRLSSASDGESCIERTDDTTLGMDLCSTDEEEQRFTYLFQEKKFVLQRSEPSSPRQYFNRSLTCMSGYDIGSGTGFGIDANEADPIGYCGTQCDNTPNCQAFEITRESNALDAFKDFAWYWIIKNYFDHLDLTLESMCILKTTAYGATTDCTDRDFFVSTGDYEITSQACMSERDPDGIGTNELERLEADWLECERQCNNNAECTGFEYCDLPGDELSLDLSDKQASLAGYPSFFGCSVSRGTDYPKRCLDESDACAFCSTCESNYEAASAHCVYDICSECSGETACEVCSTANISAACYDGSQYCTACPTSNGMHSSAADNETYAPSSAPSPVPYMCSDVCGDWQTQREALQEAARCSTCDQCESHTDACSLCDSCSDDSVCSDCVDWEVCNSDSDSFCSTYGGYETELIDVATNKNPICILRSLPVDSDCKFEDDDNNNLYTFAKTEAVPVELEQDMCLTPSDSGEIIVGPCADVTVDATLSSGSLIEWEGYGCMSLESGTIETATCDSDSSSQVWNRNAICRLSTREQTPPLQLESVERAGECLAMDVHVDDETVAACTDEEYGISQSSPGLVQCTSGSASTLQYGFSQPFEFWNALNTSQCMGRQYVEDGDGDPAVGEGGLRWLDCDVASNIAFSTWSMEDGTRFDFNNPEDTSQNYTLTVGPCSGRALSLHETRFSDSELVALSGWKQFGLGGSAVELAIRPEAALLVITDPELLYQLWLWGGKGAKARKMLFKLEWMAEIVEQVAAFVSEAEDTVTKVGATFLAATGLVSPTFTALDSIIDFAKVVDPIILFFEKVPYVGKILKAIRARTLISKAQSTLEKGKDLVSGLETAISTADTTVFTLLGKLAVFSEILEAIPGFLLTSGEIIARLLRCAYLEDNAEVQDSLDKVIDVLNSSVDFVQGVMDTFKGFMNTLENIVSDIEDTLLSPFEAIRSGLEPVEWVVDKLSFIEALYTFTVDFKYPNGIKFKVFGISISWKTVSLSLEALANFVEEIIDWIKDLGGIGWVIDKVEDLVDGILSALFPEIELPLPSFSFLEDLSLLDGIGDYIDDIVDFFVGNIVDIADVANDWMGDLLDGVDLGYVNASLDQYMLEADLPLHCDDGNFTCIFNEFPMPDVNMSGFSDAMEDALFLFDTIVDGMETALETVWDSVGLMLGNMTCTETMQLPVTSAGVLAKMVGLEGSEDCNTILNNALPKFEPCVAWSVTQEAEDHMLEIGEVFADFANNTGLPDANATDDERRLTEYTGQKIAITWTIPMKKLQCFLGKILGKASSKLGFSMTYWMAKQFSSSTEPRGAMLAFELKEVFAVTAHTWPTVWPKVTFVLGARMQFQINLTIKRKWQATMKTYYEELKALAQMEEKLQAECDQFWQVFNFISYGYLDTTVDKNDIKKLIDNCEALESHKELTIQKQMSNYPSGVVSTVDGKRYLDTSSWGGLSTTTKNDIVTWLVQTEAAIKNDRARVEQTNKLHESTLAETVVTTYEDNFWSMVSKGAVSAAQYVKCVVPKPFATSVAGWSKNLHKTFWQIRYIEKAPGYPFQWMQLVTGFQIHFGLKNDEWDDDPQDRFGLAFRFDWFVEGEDDQQQYEPLGGYDAVDNFAIMTPQTPGSQGHVGLSYHLGVGITLVKFRTEGEPWGEWGWEGDVTDMDFF